MKVLLIFLLVAVASGANLAQKQQDVLGLLYRVTEPINPKFKHLKERSESYQPTNHIHSFKDLGAAALNLESKIVENSILEQHHLFSLFNDQHREEAISIFEVLINSKDWETFASSAAYYRVKMNEGSFVYALSVAVIHSELATGVVLPPLYEITPHMFTNSEIIQKAYTAKMTQTPGKFQMNFTGSRTNPEQRVAYFGEDIGMNVHHVTWHMDYPFWWQDSYGHHLDRKGELFFWMHHQLTARFDSERLSNYLEVVDELYWTKPIVEGFAPHTTYRYGGEFPARADNAKFEDVEGIVRIRDMIIYENRIRDAIAIGYVTDRDGKRINIRNEAGIEILGSLMESSSYSPNKEYYGSLHNMAHIMLGRIGDPKGKFNMPPGVMEHFETATRDPAFFRLHKYIDNIFREHKDSLPRYTKKDVEFPVRIESVSIEGELETYFENFEFDISQAVDSTANLPDVPITASVQRLNHKDFSFKIDVSNNEGSNLFATVRIHLCPTRDSNGIRFEINEGRWHCVELDKFWKYLDAGKNTITRKSSEASTTVPDIPSFSYLLEKADAGAISGGSLNLEKYARGCGIPNRMLLPKGTSKGMEFSLVVAVTDGFKDAAVDNLENNERGGSHSLCGIHGEKYPDKKPLGYPFDRKIKDERAFLALPNVKRTLVTVTHKNQ